MAKKRISFIELHLEKVVAAITGIALLGVAYLYLIQTPNVVDDGAERYGPGDYDKKVLLAKVDRLTSGIQRPPPELESISDYAGEFRAEHETALASGRIKPAWPAIQPWRPTVPPAIGTKPRAPDQILLARVLAPAKPIAYTGLTTFKEEPPRPVDSEGHLSNDEWDALPEADRTWMTVATRFDLEAQTDEYRRADYDLESRDILFCRTRLQRQTRLSGGPWGPWEDAKPWIPYLPVQPPVLELTPQRDGPGLNLRQIEELKEYRDLVTLYQPELKQPYPPYGVAGVKWRLPPVPDVDWCALDMKPGTITAGEKDDGCNPYLAELPPPLTPEQLEAGGRPLSEAEQRRQNRIKAGRQLRDVEELAKSKRLDELLQAEDLIREIKQNPDASRRIKEQADRLLAQILPDIEKMEREQAQQAPAPGPGATPVAPQVQTRTVVWAHEVPAKPGYVYRYRIAVDLFNNYVNRYDKLQDAEAAASVWVRGEWSEPSEPVEVPPESAFFVARVEAQDVRIDIYKWFRGQVFNHRIDIKPGQAIAARDFVTLKGEKTRRVVDYDTGCTLLAADEAKPVRIREDVGRDGGFEYREDTTPCIYAVDADGNVVERSRVLDQPAQRAWSALAKE